ncbi:tRNA pseudouridine(55) synthase TruB [candidate division WOR-3 bacterium]|nr:tRNA pseudouridine(55) synthase TruB [candidate division WOR-3 bacterium]
MRGVLNVDKPSGISSYDVIRRIKLLLSSQSAIPLGHAGTLDPLASGVLLILVGEATKISRFLLNLPKEYVAGVLFGRRTDTDDTTGKTLTERPVRDLTEESVRAALDRFRGEIEQVPPAFSALKQDGRPLYRLARKGQEVRPKPRNVTVYDSELLDWHPPIANIRYRVSSGTYVRALARDLGASVGTEATLASLIRTKVGQFTVDEAVAPDTLDATSLPERLIPVDAALDGMPRVTVSPTQAQHLYQGKAVSGIDGQVPSGDGDLALAQTPERSFLAIVVSNGTELRTERIIYAS